MPPFFRFLIRRLIAIPITLFIVTVALFAILMLAPPEVRAAPYLPDRLPPHVDPEVVIQRIIRTRGLGDPFPVQYARWLGTLVRGDWGYSPVLNGPILEALLVRTPVTAELALYASLLFIPLGLISGGIAAARPDRPSDTAFRFVAFLGTSVPPFVLGLWLLAIFYVALHWFPPMRLSILQSQIVQSSDFTTFTGLMTIDGLLNRRPDITLDALRHLVLPVVTLAFSHWATLGRLTRASMVEESGRPYITAARARGIPARAVVWRHAFRNAMVPALNSTALSAASLVTGVFVVEVVFAFHGISELITNALTGNPDVYLAVGFAVFSVVLVLPIMLILDIVQAIVDPRIREGVALE